MVGWAPFTYQELGAKAKEILLGEQGVEDGAVRVLKCHDKRGGGMGEVGRWAFNLGGELRDAKVAIGWVVTEKGLVACFLGMS